MKAEEERTILKAAVTKAVDNGWNMFRHASQGKAPWFITGANEMPTPKVVEYWVPKNSLLICALGIDVYVFKEQLIFNHDFAKALWGEELVNYANIHNIVYKRPIAPDDPIWVVENRQTPNWKSKLQQMVVATDPIKYLGENI